jgi:hypothetical protein
MLPWKLSGWLRVASAVAEDEYRHVLRERHQYEVDGDSRRRELLVERWRLEVGSYIEVTGSSDTQLVGVFVTPLGWRRLLGRAVTKEWTIPSP